MDVYRKHREEPYRIVAEEVEEISCDRCIRSVDGSSTCLDPEPQCHIGLLRSKKDERHLVVLEESK